LPNWHHSDLRRFAELASTFAAKLPRCDHSVVTRLVFFHFSTVRRDFAELASSEVDFSLSTGFDRTGVITL